MKHTQGKWEIELRRGHSGADDLKRPVIMCNGKRVAVVSRSGAPNYAEKEMTANAKLIAAAPELLAAVEWINKFISTACDGGDAWCAVREQPGASEWAEDMQAAIAKATN